jgi:Subtilase family
MASSPVQIVLNSNDFISIWDRDGGGEHKDFYAGNDSDFAIHKLKLTSQLSSIKQIQNSNRFSDVTYAKVVLKQSALAKSHRPTGSIFNTIAPVVGAGDLGVILVEFDGLSIDRVSNKIMQAEPETKWKEKQVGGKVKKVANPSNLRSEVGAIEEISSYSAADKRKFSVSEGIDWLTNPQTGGAYIIELFENPPPSQNWDNLTDSKRTLFKSFYDGLLNIGIGLVVFKIVDSEKNAPMFSVRLEDSMANAMIQLSPIRSIIKRQNIPIKININQIKHSDLLRFLDDHPLVKKIALPPIITKSVNEKKRKNVDSTFSIPKTDPAKSYPKIAVVDGGVSEIFDDWVEERWGLLADQDKDKDHGTFISGLAIAGNVLNGDEVCKELDGCKIIDLDILPKEGAWDNYYRGEPLQFFRELESAVKALKAKTGVRVFNFSLNIEEHVSSDGYSLPAKLLDEIAEENDVIFIISAGNTKPYDHRKEWPIDSLDALSILASSRNDTIKKPAESYRNLSVSALNPPNLKGIVPYALSSYSCRGPGIRIGLKPDLAHIGGAGPNSSGHGLFSLDAVGNKVEGCGTSYATPNVSKTIACLDNAIEGDVSRESLMALSIHHAVIPELLKNKQLKNIAKDLIGFGIPSSSTEILEGSENAITLVFANRIFNGRRMSFNFSWPASLFDAELGKCFGHARLTVVSTPPFNYKYGAEFVRVNIEGHLRQQQKEGNYKGRLDPLYLPDASAGMLYEKNQIAHSFKWSPIKVFEKTFPKGVGPSSDWKLEIEYLARDGESLPIDGIPFTALLTISDPEKKKPVFNDMRQSLQSKGVKIVDIMTAARIVPRV